MKIILFLLLVIGLGPALSGLLLIYFESKREMIDSTGEYFREVSSFAAQEIEISLRDRISMTFWLASLPAIRAALAAPPLVVDEPLGATRGDVIPEFATSASHIRIYRANGEIVLSSEGRKEAASLPKLPDDFAQQGRAFVQIANTTEGEPRFRLDIFTPVLDRRGRLAGIVESSSSVDRLFDRVRGLRLGDTGHHNLVDSDATILFCSLYQLTAHHVDPTLIHQISDRKSGWTRTDERSHQFVDAIIGFAKVDKTDLRIHPDSYAKKQWIVFTTQDPDETGAPLRDYRVVVASYGAALIVLTSLLGLIAFRMIFNAQKRHEGELVSRAKSDSIRQLLQSYHQLSIDSLAEVEALLADLERQGADRCVARRISKIRRGLATVGSSLDHLSYFAGGGVLAKSSVALRTLVDETALMLEPIYTRARVDISLFGEERDLIVQGDERLLRLLLLNVFMNAIQAVCPGEGKIQVALSTNGRGGAQVTVTDNGEGIVTEHIEEIFDPFYSTKKGASQRGLGLAACLGIVNAHGGEIAVMSAPGSGCVVTVTLPLQPFSESERQND